MSILSASRTVRTVFWLVLVAGFSLLSQAATPADFTVEAPASGQKFRLADARGKFVALHFLLKTECPVCLRHTREYARRAGELPDVVQIFLKPDSANDIQAWVGKLGDGAAGQPVIYRDPEASLARQFRIPDGYRFHGESVHYPALVLLDPTGAEVFRHVGKNNGDRFGFEALAAKVAGLRSAVPTAPPRRSE